METNVENSNNAPPGTRKVNPSHLMQEFSDFVEVPSHSNAVESELERRKTLKDLPAPPKDMNAVAVVLMYTQYGLRDDAISDATGLQIDQIRNIRNLDAYKKVSDELVEKIINEDSEDVRAILQSGAKIGATRLIVEAAKGGKQSVKAASEILDRTGNRAVDVVEHRHKMEGGLTINIVRPNDGEQTPVIDLKPVEVIEHAE